MGVTMNHAAAVFAPLIGGLAWYYLGYQVIFFGGVVLTLISLGVSQWLDPRDCWPGRSCRLSSRLREASGAGAPISFRMRSVVRRADRRTSAGRFPDGCCRRQSTGSDSGGAGSAPQVPHLEKVVAQAKCSPFGHIVHAQPIAWGVADLEFQVLVQVGHTDVDRRRKTSERARACSPAQSCWAASSTWPTGTSTINVS